MQFLLTSYLFVFFNFFCLNSYHYCLKQNMFIDFIFKKFCNKLHINFNSLAIFFFEKFLVEYFTRIFFYNNIELLLILKKKSIFLSCLFLLNLFILFMLVMCEIIYYLIFISLPILIFLFQILITTFFYILFIDNIGDDFDLRHFLYYTI